MQNLFDEIRSTTAHVAQNGRHVRVIGPRIEALVTQLQSKTVGRPTLDVDAHFVAAPDETVAFFLTLDAINFGSGYFPHLSKLPGKSGYFTIATRLTEHFRAHGPMSAQQLTGIDSTTCRTIFKQNEDGGPVDELISLFVRALNDLGKLLRKDFAGSFVALVESADHSAQQLARILDRMPMFHDVQRYHDFQVPFFKRAQLTAADLNLALGGTGLGEFSDLDQLTIFADNLVPHVLRCEGVLEYSSDLSNRIERGELIESGSEGEIEIRACAVHASELLARSLGVTAMKIDYLLWNAGQKPEYKSRPRHRCRTWFY